MKILITSLLICCSLTVNAKPNPMRTKIIHCASDEHRQKICTLKGNIKEVRVVKQASKSPCIINKTWFFESPNIRVEKGCRADFEYTEVISLGDLNFAPDAFSTESGKKAVLSDIQNVQVSFIIDKGNKTLNRPPSAKAQAIVQFKILEAGWPLLDLVPEPTKILIDGISIPAQSFPRKTTPNDNYQFNLFQSSNPAPMRQLQADVSIDEIHTLYIEYPLPTEANRGWFSDPFLNYSDKAVEALFDSSDRDGLFGFTSFTQHFWERFAPSNLEYDHYAQTVRIKIIGNATNQLIFHNGKKIQKTAQNEWLIEYPEYFSSSSFYLQLTDKTKLGILENYSLKGKEKMIPVTIYVERSLTEGMSELEVRNSLEKIKSTIEASFIEMENTYGPYGHPRFVTCLSSQSGFLQPGSFSILFTVEYAGAVFATDQYGNDLDSALSNLNLYIGNSWFGRGVLPADGPSGWIDESFAAWRSKGYPSKEYSPIDLARSYLGVGNGYRRETTGFTLYVEEKFFSALDFYLKAQGYQPGLKSVLRKLYQEKNHQTINNDSFKNFIEQSTGISVESYFSAAVFGIMP